MDYEDVILSETSRRVLYKCLAKCFQLPDAGLKESAGEAKRHLIQLESRALPHVKLLCNSLNVCSNFKDLQVEFARLFVGPYSLLAPPYGSIYLDDRHQVMGQSTLSAIQFYQEAGLEVASTHKEAPDHIATELEFMYFLIHEELKTIETGDHQGFLDKLCLQNEFLLNHLNLWAKAFVHRIKSNTQTDFYVNLADVLDIFIGEDANYLIKLECHQTTNA